MSDNFKAFIGLDENNSLALYASPYPINLFGPRLKRGKEFPEAVYKFYQEPHNATELAPAALKAAQAYLRGEEWGSGGTGIVFGRDTVKSLKGRK